MLCNHWILIFYLVGIVLVYDISRRESFDNLEMWIKEVHQYCDGGLERIRMVLIGNKLDLKNQRQVLPVTSIDIAPLFLFVPTNSLYFSTHPLLPP